MRLMLHDNYGMSQDGQLLPVWPPVQWNDFRPTSREQILEHYYAYSAGCQKPTLWGGIALAAGAAATAGFGTAALGGAKAALIGIKSKAISGGSAIIGKEAADTISKSVERSAAASAKKASNTTKQKARRQLDGKAEKDRIVDTYLREYARMDGRNFAGKVGAMDLNQLEAELAKQKGIVKASEDKCKKLPCDTAGCRNMGVLNSRVQYIQALIAAFKSSGTTTPAEYNAKFTDKALKGETSMAGFGGAILPLLIVGGLLLSRFKK